MVQQTLQSSDKRTSSHLIIK